MFKRNCGLPRSYCHTMCGNPRSFWMAWAERTQVGLPHAHKHRFSFSLKLWRWLFWVHLSESQFFLSLLERGRICTCIKTEECVLCNWLILYPILTLHIVSYQACFTLGYLFIVKKGEPFVFILKTPKVPMVNVRALLVVWWLHKGTCRGRAVCVCHSVNCWCGWSSSFGLFSGLSLLMW